MPNTDLVCKGWHFGLLHPITEFVTHERGMRSK